MAFCQNCGNELPGGAPFCQHCGAAQQPPAPQMQMRQGQPVPQQMPQQQPFASQMQQQAAPQRQMRQPQPPAKKSKKGLIIGLVCGGVVLVAGIVVLLVLLLGNKGNYQVFVENQLQGVFTEGQRVTLKYPLATDTSYTFSSDDVSFSEEYEDGTAVLSFAMPAHDVTIHVNSRNTMQPQPEPEPEPEPEPGPDPIASMFGEEGWVQGNEPVSVAFSEEVSLMTENLDAIEMDTSEYALRIVFGAKENVYDVTLYTGMIVDFTSDSAVFAYQEKLFLGDMLPREFFLAEMSFAGDFPTNAFSCVDENGRTHSYMIGTSGMDGSLYLEECTLQETDETGATGGMAEIGGHYISILVPEEDLPLLSNDAYYYEVSDGADLTIFHRESGEELCRISVCNKNEIDINEHISSSTFSGPMLTDFYGYIREADGRMDYYVIRYLYPKETILQNRPEYAEELSRLYDMLLEQSAPENLIIPNYGQDGTRELVPAN